MTYESILMLYMCIHLFTWYINRVGKGKQGKGMKLTEREARKGKERKNKTKERREGKRRTRMVKRTLSRKVSERLAYFGGQKSRLTDLHQFGVPETEPKRSRN